MALNMFKFNSKDTRTTSVKLCDVFTGNSDAM